MSKKKGLGCFSIVLVSGFLLAVMLSGLYFFYLGPNLLEDKRAGSVPPTVIVHTPSRGDTAAEGDLLTASATATSRNPMARLEVWLDGEKYQEQVAQGSTNNLYVSFEIEMKEGTHVIAFRAVDAAGLVGQSAPIPVTGTPGIATLVTEEGGQTMADIAQAMGVAQDEINNLNPDLGNGGLPSGTHVNVPKPPPQGGGGQGSGPPGGEPPGGGPPGGEPPGGGPPGGEPPGGGDKGGDPKNGDDQDEGPTGSGSWGSDGQDNGIPYEVVAADLPPLTSDISNLISAAFANMPKAPSSFYAKYKDCVVELHWQDNAENETHFNVWMQRVYGPPQLIKTTGPNPKNGPTTFKFKAPHYGFYEFWIEAGGTLGSQPSERKEVFVSDPCASNIATHLEIEALDMYVYAPYERIYCFLSLDGGEHRRIPEGGTDYILVKNNWGDITTHWGGEKKILYPMPEDEELTLSGTCLANLGPTQVSPFTNFYASVPRSKWDGSRLEIKTDAFLVGYRVKPHGPEQASGSFEYVDFDLPSPHIWSVEAEGELQFPEKDFKARTVTITWGWMGDPNEITNFVILMDGKEIRHVNKNHWRDSILLGSACGQRYSFEIVAVGTGGARSAPSNTKYLEQPPCPVMAEVHFLTVISKATDDTDCIPPLIHTCLPYTAGSCDAIGVAYDLWAEGSGHKRVVLEYGKYVAIHYECGIEYQFSKQLGATQDKILVPIDPSNPEIRFGTTFWEDDKGPSGDDIFGKVDYPLRYDYDKWPNVDENFTFTTPFSDDTADATIKVRVRGFAYAGGSLELYSP